MKRASFFALLMAVASIVVPFTSNAQTTGGSSVADRFVISARAGGVSFVDGAVSVTRTNGTAGLLLKRDQVEIGEQVSTGSDGRAEILLNPGSYVRLGKNSTFEFGATDLEDLTIKLSSGSAIFEVFAADEFRVSVITPKGKVSLIETGVYRVDVASDGSAIASVTKGKAEIGEVNAVVVKDGRTGTLNGGQVAIAKFDKDERDEFAQWSRNRSKELTKINSSLSDRALDTALARGFRQGIWSLRDSVGLWVYDFRSGGYCFLPYGFNWRSPYGGWYGNGIYPAYVPLGPVRTDKRGLVRSVSTHGTGSTPTPRPITRVTRSTGKTSDGNDPLPITKVGRGSKGSVFSQDFPSSTRGFEDSETRSRPIQFPSAPASTPTTSAPIAPKDRAIRP
jgi:hypothetical protein